MEVKEVEVTKKEKIYQLTESQYEELIVKEREYGSLKIKDYIIFCYNNFICEKNVYGILSFACDLMNFVTDKNDYTRNLYELSFWDWLKQNR